jgi:membrane-associated protease RseP (regulator of RpoE activity)
MMRALLLLAAIPTVINANDEVVQVSCASPASVEPRAPRPLGGDRIVFTKGTDWRIGVATLDQNYSLSSGFPAKDWNVSTDGVLVGPLTAAQIAELRCDAVVERIILGPRTPESPGHEPTRPAVRLGIEIMFDPTGRSGLTSDRALVIQVNSGSVAERAGLLPGDKIVRFDDHDIGGADVPNIMATKKPGDTVGMVVIRNGVETPLVAQF